MKVYFLSYRSFSLLLFAFLMMSCGKSDKGQLVGAEGKKWYPEKPYGMVLIEGGSFIMGKSDADIAAVKDAPPKTVTVPSFYMDETEITNAEYRQFVEKVRDSVIRQKLAEAAELAGGAGENEDGIQRFAYKNSGGDEEELTAFEEFSKHYDPLDQALNWDPKIIWNPAEYPDEDYVYVMDEFYLTNDQSYNGRRMLDVTQFKYRYKTMDVEAAARTPGDRTDFITEKEVLVYPDTTVWIKDFYYSYNEPMHNNYFSHTAYDEYPVVGVTWGQAKAFANWRTKYLNDYRKKKDKASVSFFRLPSEAEWEYAARGGIEGGTYPWGGPYAKDDRACFLANFKPFRGDYAADGALYTVEGDAYGPNDFGLYNMSGNVSEWVNTTYDPSSYEYMSTISPNVSSSENIKKVIRGGSWKDVSYYLQVSTRDYEYSDSARSFIGFRTVQDFLGNSFNLNK
ncbi:gliding motility lipoprotein GldK [Psychroflexus sp. YR1-1]|uniref:Gliding motility lipoprotein GldK n=1 Tax=Psychroflexus aurantiacus TaxID=2709310 RepID=A0A6B3R2E6_9FLAO|nr:gliding motility lipoprotein GldK [Psychroflexus aurantiacus]NEV94829.1 gliding motility lipoprotein GldK [Psychroflexus aurantiacus]